jgi:hypothetical protein
MSESTATELVTVTQRRIQCRHVHLAGRQCGSPALRREHFCYFHHATRRPKPYPGKFRHLDAHEPFELPVVEDRASALSVASQILSRIASNDLDPTRAGRLLYNLQVVASLLPRPARASNPNPNSSLDDIAHEPILVEELIDDEIHGPIAPITEYLPPAPNPVILSEEHSDEPKACPGQGRRNPEAPHSTPDFDTIQASTALRAVESPQPATLPALQAGATLTLPRLGKVLAPSFQIVHGSRTNALTATATLSQNRSPEERIVLRKNY